jgi:hypothetical protein
VRKCNALHIVENIGFDVTPIQLADQETDCSLYTYNITPPIIVISMNPLLQDGSLKIKEFYYVENNEINSKYSYCETIFLI